MSQFTIISADQSVSVELHPDRWVAVDLTDGLRRVIFRAVIDGTLTSSPQFNRLQSCQQAASVYTNSKASCWAGHLR